MSVESNGRNCFLTRRACPLWRCLTLLVFGATAWGADVDGRAALVGDDACISCHREKVESYQRTAHSRTSRLPTRETIHGSFAPGSNVLRTVDTNLFFEMDATADGFFQKAVRQVSPSVTGHRTERIDLVIGSGRKGQTYLFWKGDRLFELPVSYWTEFHEWVNSPGYRDGLAFFDRPVSPRCLECHATFFETLPAADHRFNPAHLVLGITCEKCHGPGGEHVARYRSASPPRSRADGAILNPATFSRDRQIDVCGLCHAPRDPLPNAPALSYVPGAVLDEYLQPPKANSNARVDVHGGQVQLMKSSRCFQMSGTMTCTTCHDVHAPQRDVQAMAVKCLACHQVESCGVARKSPHDVKNQCVICHMPLQQTELIISSANGRKLQPKVRTHRIAIYPDASAP